MIKRTIEISRSPAHLAVREGQLLIVRKGERLADAPSVPCEDVGVVLVDHPQTTYTHAALCELASRGGALVVCGRDHLPAGVLLPVSGHTEVAKRLRSQISASRPLQKRLWKQIVQAKIRQQAGNLNASDHARKRLLELAREVRSGDASNAEAQAAKVYWSSWLGGGSFRRDPDGGGVNALLNYGYATLRAGVARAIVGAGLHPALGIHHHNRSNAFALADDLVEPLRPAVDARVRSLNERGQTELDQPTKASLLDLLTAATRTGDEEGPLMVALHRYAASLAKCFEGESKELDIPIVDLSWCA